MTDLEACRRQVWQLYWIVRDLQPYAPPEIVRKSENRIQQVLQSSLPAGFTQAPIVSREQNHPHATPSCLHSQSKKNLDCFRSLLLNLHRCPCPTIHLCCWNAMSSNGKRRYPNMLRAYQKPKIGAEDQRKFWKRSCISMLIPHQRNIKPIEGTVDEKVQHYCKITSFGFMGAEI